MGGADPGQVVLGSKRKQAEQARRSTPVSSTLSLSVGALVFPLQIRALTFLPDALFSGSVSQTNPKFLNWFCSGCFITAIKSKETGV